MTARGEWSADAGALVRETCRGAGVLVHPLAHPRVADGVTPVDQVLLDERWGLRQAGGRFGEQPGLFHWRREGVWQLEVRDVAVAAPVRSCEILIHIGLQ